MASESSSGLAWFLVGAGVGTVLGMLLAPASGAETRERLGDWLKERKEEGADFLERVKEKLPEKGHRIGAAIKAGKEAYETAELGDKA